jgi:hypothetical protein
VFGERLLDPLARAQLVGELALKSRRTVPEPPGVEELRRQLTVTAAPPGPVPLPASSLPEPPSLPVTPPDGPILLTPGGVSAELAAQTALLVQMLEVNRRLLEEMVSLRTGNAVRGSAAAALDRRLAMLERMLAGGRPADPGGGTLAEARESRQPEGNEPEPVTLESVVREAAVTLDEDLLIADPAILAAAQSPFQDVERAAAVLDAMALVSRQRQAGTLGRSLREAFRELGVDYRPGIAETTSARLREQYRVRLADGQEVEATEHIAVGNSYDPRYCLRIYFSSRVSAEPRFVVAHVGRHHEVGSST